jgi:hypothetical protein
MTNCGCTCPCDVKLISTDCEMVGCSQSASDPCPTKGEAVEQCQEVCGKEDGSAGPKDGGGDGAQPKKDAPPLDTSAPTDVKPETSSAKPG